MQMTCYEVDRGASWQVAFWAAAAEGALCADDGHTHTHTHTLITVTRQHAAGSFHSFTGG